MARSILTAWKGMELRYWRGLWISRIFTMRSHTTRGEEICRHLKSLDPVLPIIRSHHERWDGTVYPDGLEGDGTPLLARALDIADIYDAKPHHARGRDLSASEIARPGASDYSKPPRAMGWHGLS